MLVTVPHLISSSWPPPKMPQTRSQVKKAKLLDYAPYPIRLARKPTRKCVNSRFPPKPAAGSGKSKSQRRPQSKPSLQPVILAERNIPERPRGEVTTYVAPSGKRYRKTLKETMQTVSPSLHAVYAVRHPSLTKFYPPVGLRHEHGRVFEADKSPDRTLP